MIRKYYNRKLQTNPRHREEEPHNNHFKDICSATVVNSNLMTILHYSIEPTRNVHSLGIML